MIAVDIHDVLGGYVERMIQVYGPPAEWPSGGDHILRRMFPQVNFDLHFDPANNRSFLTSIPAFTDAVPGMWRLRQMGVPFCYFTATNEEYRPVIADWLAQYMFPPADLIMTVPSGQGGFVDKANKLSEMPDITSIIDDAEDVLYAAADLGLGCYVYDRPWNRDCRIGSRVLGWADFLRRVTTDFGLYGYKGEWQ